MFVRGKQPSFPGLNVDTPEGREVGKSLAKNFGCVAWILLIDSVSDFSSSFLALRFLHEELPQPPKKAKGPLQGRFLAKFIARGKGTKTGRLRNHRSVMEARGETLLLSIPRSVF
jgi:hypothetical protein